MEWALRKKNIYQGLWSTHIRNMLPKVWSSLRNVNVPVFVIFESGVYDTFDKPSGTTTKFNLSGIFVMSRIKNLP